MYIYMLYIYISIVEVSFSMGHPMIFHEILIDILLIRARSTSKSQDFAWGLTSAYTAAITHLTWGSGRRGKSMDTLWKFDIAMKMT